MVITDFNLGSIARVVIEIEADTPLPVNAYAPLPFSCANQFFKHVSWRNAKIINPPGGIDQGQFCLCQRLHFAWEFPYLLAGENSSGYLVFE